MQKIYKLIFILMFFSFSTGINAMTCDSTYRGWWFDGVGIQKSGKTKCFYKYCYYTCTYDSYSVEGSWKPKTGNWTTDDKGSNCGGWGQSGNCVFQGK